MNDKPSTTPSTGWQWTDTWIDLEQVRTQSDEATALVGAYLLGIQEFVADLVGGTSSWRPPAYLQRCKYGMTFNCGVLAEARRSQSGFYGIAVDAIAPIQMMIVFRQLLSHPQILPDLGCVDGAPNGRQLLRLKPEGPVVLVDGSHEPLAGDQIRNDTLSFLIHRALQFMYWHEMGHIADGHTDYLAVDMAPSYALATRH